MKTLSDILRKANPPAVPPRMPARQIGQKKLQEVNQEGTQTKRAPQPNPITNTEPLRVTIVEAYPYELQLVNQAKNRHFFSANQKPALNSYTKSEK